MTFYTSIDFEFVAGSDNLEIPNMVWDGSIIADSATTLFEVPLVPVTGITSYYKSIDFELIPGSDISTYPNMLWDGSVVIESYDNLVSDNSATGYVSNSTSILLYNTLDSEFVITDSIISPMPNCVWDGSIVVDDYYVPIEIAKIISDTRRATGKISGPMLSSNLLLPHGLDIDHLLYIDADGRKIGINSTATRQLSVSGTTKTNAGIFNKADVAELSIIDSKIQNINGTIHFIPKVLVPQLQIGQMYVTENSIYSDNDITLQSNKINLTNTTANSIDVGTVNCTSTANIIENNIKIDSFNGSLKIVSDAVVLPSGSDLDRIYDIGITRYNTDTDKVETFNGISWSNVDYGVTTMTEAEVSDIMVMWSVVLD